MSLTLVQPSLSDIRDINTVREAWTRGAMPDPDLLVSEWADRYRMLSEVSSDEPGQWRTSRTPYLKMIMDCLSPEHPAQRVIFEKGAQIGGTEAGNNWMGYVIHQAPGPMLAVSPTVEMAKRNSKQRINNLISDSPELRKLVKDKRQADSGNTILSKEFPGGVLVLAGANSAVGLRSMPARYLFLDEVDGYPNDVDGEGDPIALAMRAVRNFQRRKIFVVSTPALKGSSKIEREYNSAQRRYRYFVPCPSCSKMQTLEWAQMKWSDEVAPFMECKFCKKAIQEHHKTWMLANGEWITDRDKGEKVVAFHLSALYSPYGWFSWGDAVDLFEKSEEDPALKPNFHNTVLGLPYQEPFEAPNWKVLYDRREKWEIPKVPDKALFLTAGVDVQKDRLECEVVAWGRRKISWSVNYLVFEGETTGEAVWDSLDELLEMDFQRFDGRTMPIRVMAIDSGFLPQPVYDFCRPKPQPAFGPAGSIARQPRTAVATKGQGKAYHIVQGGTTEGGKNRKRGLRVWHIGTGIIKGELYSYLRQEPPTEAQLQGGFAYPNGYCHVPDYAEEYFKQMTSEKRVTKLVKGFPVESWEKEGNARNEVLDCRVYARAAAALFGMDRFNEKDWSKLERLYKVDTSKEVAPPKEVEAPIPAAARPAPNQSQVTKRVLARGRRIVRSSWMST